MDQQLANLLLATLNPDTTTRVHAELALTETLKNPEAGVSLASILTAQDADVALRQISSILKKYVTEYWSPQSPHFKGIAPPQAKDRIRAQVFSGLSDHSRKIRTSCAFVLSNIAKWDWPEDYPTLLNDLIGLLGSNNPNSIHGSMHLLSEFVQNELAEDQMLPVLRQLLPTLLSILGNPTAHSYLTRARAIAVFRQCVTALNMVRKEYPDAVKTALTTVIPEWIQAFQVLLTQDPLADVANASDWDPLAVRIQIFKTLDIIQTNFSAAIKPFVEQLLTLTAQNLTTLMPIFRSYYLTGSGNPPPPQSVDDPDMTVSLQHLACPALDFICEAARKQKSVVWVGENVGSIISLALYWAQMTTEDEETWADDANAFIRDEETDLEAYTARVGALDLISDLVGLVGLPALAQLWAATLQQVEELAAAKVSHRLDWWRPLEACLAAIDCDAVTNAIEDEKDANRPAPIDVELLLTKIIPGLINDSSAPFLQGRSFIAASEFAKFCPASLVSEYLNAAVTVLESSNAAAPVKVAALKAVRNLCSVDDDKALGPLGPRIISALAPFVSTVTEDALALVLEGLSAVIEVEDGSWLTPDQVATIVQMLLVTFEKNVNDPIAMDILTESFTSLASSGNPAIYQAAIISAVPALVPMLSKDDPWIVTSTLRILRALFNEAKPGALGDGVVALVGHSLFAVMEAAKDRDLLSDGVQLVSTMVRKDTAQLLNWVDPVDGKSGLDKVLNVVSKLVEQDEEESGGLGIGDLLVSLYRRAGDVINNNTALLQSLVRRLKFAKTATFAQSLILPFAFLINNGHRETILELLENTPVPDRDGSFKGWNGLGVLIESWCENAETFIGTWAWKTGYLALEQLFLSPRPSLQQLPVTGDLIISAETSNVIVTRSRAKKTPHQFTTITFSLKALKLIIKALQVNGESATLAVAKDIVDAGDDEVGVTLILTSLVQANCETHEKDDEDWDDEDAVAEAIALSEAVKLEEGGGDEAASGLNEADLAEDPIMQINFTAHTVEFLRSCAAQNVNNFSALADQLSAEELLVLKQAVHA